MFDAISPSDLRLPRARGAASLTVSPAGLARLAQSAPCRILFPRPPQGEPLHAVLANTAGGVAGGDRLEHAVGLQPGAAALIVGQAAEKLYRSSGEEARIRAEVSVAGGAACEWLPQGTIMFDGARLRRATEFEVAAGGRALAGEVLTFGRLAMGERFRSGYLLDSWRVRYAGRLVWADALRLVDAAPLDARVGFDGARCLATLIYVAERAGHALQAARALLARTAGALRAGVTAFEHVLIARWLGRDPAEARGAFGAFWTAFRALALGRPERMPAIWNA